MIQTWLAGRVDQNATPAQRDMATNPIPFISRAELGTYAANTKVFKCPVAQISPDQVPPGRGGIDAKLKTRSYSMNARVGANSAYGGSNPRFAADTATLKISILRMDDFVASGAFQNTNCSPSFTWVFIEEADSSMDDASFYLSYSNPPNWGNERPATYHGLSGSLSFADGHVEINKYNGFPPPGSDQARLWPRY
jgi:prepilin-type processing-associated H-X9-DG protein